MLDPAHTNAFRDDAVREAETKRLPYDFAAAAAASDKRAHAAHVEQEIVRTVGRQVPSVGRVVHYQAYGTPGGEHPSVPRAAIITDAWDYGNKVSLCVLNPSGMFFNLDVPFSAEPKPGHWSWPPFVPPAKA